MSADEIRAEAKAIILAELDVREAALTTQLHKNKVADKVADIRQRIETKAGEPVFVQLDLSPDATPQQINNALRVIGKLKTNLTDE